MSFTSIVYVLFLIATGILYYCVPKKAQWIVLLVASLTFFTAASEVLVAYLIGTTFVVYLGGLAIQKKSDNFTEKRKLLEIQEKKELKAKTKKQQKAILTSVVILCIGILAVLKYCNLFADITNYLAKLFHSQKTLPVFNIVLPLGISYYTLMLISYIVDVYRQTVKAETNFFRLLLFSSYFPHITEGPFDRYDNLNKQFRTPHPLDCNVIKNGALLIMFGFFKKLIIADRAGLIVSGIFEKSNNLGSIAVFSGAILYTLQLYADFSGCIDIVRGSSQMFGIDIAENFKQPFFSRSINEFWQRWHITLGAWLKDYVFFSVSLSENFKKVNSFAKKHFKNNNLIRLLPPAYALFFVWFCNGIWHGSGIKYIFYGLYYYVLMMAGEIFKPLTENFCKRLKINRQSKPFEIFQMLRTFLIVNFGMLIFRSETLSEAFGYLKPQTIFNPLKEISVIVNIENIELGDYIILFLGIAVLFVIGLLKEKGHSIRTELFQKPLYLRWAVYILLIFSTIIFGVYGGNFSNAGMIYAEF